jgi:DNA modification methylase
MKKNSWIVIWFTHGQFYDTVYHTALKAGFKGNAMPGIWIKRTGQTQQPDYNLANVSEMFFYMRKGDARIVKSGRSNIFDYTPVPAAKKIHICERPIGLIKDILATFARPNSNILVPFLGSGKTILAADDEHIKMNAFGFELSNEFKNRFINKVMNGTPGKYSELEVNV